MKNVCVHRGRAMEKDRGNTTEKNIILEGVIFCLNKKPLIPEIYPKIAFESFWQFSSTK